MDSLISKSERILAAVQARREDPKRPLRDLATLFNVSHTTISNHIKGKSRIKPDYSVTRQRLTPAEEAVLIKFI
jgi:predicted transcriptional regulator